MPSCLNVSPNIDLTIYERGTFDVDIVWSTGTVASPTPVDITGYSGVMKVKLKYSDVTPIFNLTTQSIAWVVDGPTGLYITSPSLGKFKLYINNNDTIGICPSHKDLVGVYNVFLTSGSGETVYRQSGAANLIASCVW